MTHRDTRRSRTINFGRFLAYCINTYINKTSHQNVLLHIFYSPDSISYFNSLKVSARISY